MHNNYFFLQKLAKRLSETLIGATVLRCYSQAKDELIIEFLLKDDSLFYIRAHLTSAFSCLSFPAKLSRGRRNTIDLFAQMIGESLISIKTFEYERSFMMEFNSHIQLLFKMHGNRANIILFENERVIEMFHKRMTKDLEIDLKSISERKKPDFDKIFTLEDIKREAPFLLGVPEYYLKSKGWISYSNAQKQKLIQQLLRELQAAKHYLVTEIEGKVHLSIVDTGTVINQYPDAIEGINSFFIKYLKHTEAGKIKRELSTAMNKSIASAQNYLSKNKKRLKALEDELNYRHLADLIMANMYLIKKGAKQVEIVDFYQENKIISVKLKPTLTAQKNAEHYYRKAKNQSIETKKLRQNIKEKEDQVARMTEKIQLLGRTDDLMELRKLKDDFIISTKSDQSRINLPFHRRELDEYLVYVGKSAKGNDQMLQKYTSKNDLWLHAKDTQGSHVIIKKQGNHPFPRYIIEKAAQLAAFYSKRKGEALCPVSYTDRKYVRKRKGAAPGAVIVEREKVVMVVPSDLK